MNIEEAINNLKKYINFSEKECNFPSVWDWNWHMALAYDVETLLTAYEKEKEKNKKIEKELEKHIKFCEQEAEGSLNNEICHISLKFNKRLLDIINEEK